MAYEIHIERVPAEGSRTDSPILLDEWKSFVAETEELRLDASAKSITNPATGEVITIGGKPGNAEMMISGEWLPVFRWASGRITFKADRSFNDPESQIRSMSQRIAEKLNAQVVGDDGEFYH